MQCASLLLIAAVRGSIAGPELNSLDLANLDLEGESATSVLAFCMFNPEKQCSAMLDDQRCISPMQSLHA